MATSLICGFETNSIYESDAAISSGAVDTVTSPVHSGSYALRADPVGSTTELKRFHIRHAGGAAASLFRSCQFYMRIDTLPNANGIAILGTGSPGFSATAPDFGLFLNSNGTIYVKEEVGGTSNTSTSAFTPDKEWHRV